ncbi:MAG: ChbG/HpnK family deacetylase, partial [Microcystaceae cyanobacterium]
EAVELAQQNPNLGVGLHLVLVCGRSQLSPVEIPSLVDKNGKFSDDPVKAGLSYQFNAQAQLELVKEIRTQLIAFQQTGLNLSHVDGHLHLHTHPIVLNILKDLAPEFNIPYIRLPYEELQFNLRINSQNLLIKLIQSQIFNQLRYHGEKVLQSAEILTTDRVYGLLQTGQVTADYLLKLLPKIQASKVEIYAHPDAIANRINPTGPIELQALLSQQVRDSIASCGFELVNYHQLKG